MGQDNIARRAGRPRHQFSDVTCPPSLPARCGLSAGNIRQGQVNGGGVQELHFDINVSEGLTGSDGSAYYTADHYATFKKLR